jgi:hypothetical protein
MEFGEILEEWKKSRGISDKEFYRVLLADERRKKQMEKIIKYE